MRVANIYRKNTTRTLWVSTYFLILQQISFLLHKLTLRAFFQPWLQALFTPLHGLYIKQHLHQQVDERYYNMQLYLLLNNFMYYTVYNYFTSQLLPILWGSKKRSGITHEESLLEFYQRVLVPQKKKAFRLQLYGEVFSRHGFTHGTGGQTCHFLYFAIRPECFFYVFGSAHFVLVRAPGWLYHLGLGTTLSLNKTFYSVVNDYFGSFSHMLANTSVYRYFTCGYGGASVFDWRYDSRFSLSSEQVGAQLVFFFVSWKRIKANKQRLFFFLQGLLSIKLLFFTDHVNSRLPTLPVVRGHKSFFPFKYQQFFSLFLLLGRVYFSPFMLGFMQRRSKGVVGFRPLMLGFYLVGKLFRRFFLRVPVPEWLQFGFFSGSFIKGSWVHSMLDVYPKPLRFFSSSRSFLPGRVYRLAGYYNLSFHGYIKYFIGFFFKGGLAPQWYRGGFGNPLAFYFCFFYFFSAYAVLNCAPQVFLGLQRFLVVGRIQPRLANLYPLFSCFYKGSFCFGPSTISFFSRHSLIYPFVGSYEALGPPLGMERIYQLSAKCYVLSRNPGGGVSVGWFKSSGIFVYILKNFGRFLNAYALVNLFLSLSAITPGFFYKVIFFIGNLTIFYDLVNTYPLGGWLFGEDVRVLLSTLFFLLRDKFLPLTFGNVSAIPWYPYYKSSTSAFYYNHIGHCRYYLRYFELRRLAFFNSFVLFDREPLGLHFSSNLELIRFFRFKSFFPSNVLGNLNSVVQGLNLSLLLHLWYNSDLYTPLPTNYYSSNYSFAGRLIPYGGSAQRKQGLYFGRTFSQWHLISKNPKIWLKNRVDVANSLHLVYVNYGLGPLPYTFNIRIRIPDYIPLFTKLVAPGSPSMAADIRTPEFVTHYSYAIRHFNRYARIFNLAYGPRFWCRAGFLWGKVSNLYYIKGWLSVFRNFCFFYNKHANMVPMLMGVDSLLALEPLVVLRRTRNYKSLKFLRRFGASEEVIHDKIVKGLFSYTLVALRPRAFDLYTLFHNHYNPDNLKVRVADPKYPWKTISEKAKPPEHNIAVVLRRNARYRASLLGSLDSVFGIGYRGGDACSLQAVDGVLFNIFCLFLHLRKRRGSLMPVGGSNKAYRHKTRLIRALRWSSFFFLNYDSKKAPKKTQVIDGPINYVGMSPGYFEGFLNVANKKGFYVDLRKRKKKLTKTRLLGVQYLCLCSACTCFLRSRSFISGSFLLVNFYAFAFLYSLYELKNYPMSVTPQKLSPKKPGPWSKGRVKPLMLRGRAYGYTLFHKLTGLTRRDPYESILDLRLLRYTFGPYGSLPGYFERGQMVRKALRLNREAMGSRTYPRLRNFAINYRFSVGRTMGDPTRLIGNGALTKKHAGFIEFIQSGPANPVSEVGLVDRMASFSLKKRFYYFFYFSVTYARLYTAYLKFMGYVYPFSSKGHVLLPRGTNPWQFSSFPKSASAKKARSIRNKGWRFKFTFFELRHYGTNRFQEFIYFLYNGFVMYFPSIHKACLSPSVGVDLQCVSGNGWHMLSRYFLISKLRTLRLRSCLLSSVHRSVELGNRFRKQYRLHGFLEDPLEDEHLPALVPSPSYHIEDSFITRKVVYGLVDVRLSDLSALKFVPRPLVAIHTGGCAFPKKYVGGVIAELYVFAKCIVDDYNAEYLVARKFFRIRSYPKIVAFSGRFSKELGSFRQAFSIGVSRSTALFERKRHAQFFLLYQKFIKNMEGLSVLFCYFRRFFLQLCRVLLFGFFIKYFNCINIAQ